MSLEEDEGRVRRLAKRTEPGYGLSEDVRVLSSLVVALIDDLRGVPIEDEDELHTG